ncbi:exosome complex protein Rrp42 [Candidatus Woesearchaeota archaeon]|nr:exosome complex protein Rrp42 [Candidatus Woesearchaeota archaeon]
MVVTVKEHLLRALNKNMRYDGRKLNDYRSVSVTYDISKSAEGSASVRIGDTVVLVGVKLGIETPYGDTPNKGNLMVNVELRPLSSPKFEPGPPGDQAIELARVVDRGIREAKAIDVKKLCIKEGEKVWSVIIDICSLNDDGNLFDAAALGTIAALKNARFPKVDEKFIIDYNSKTDKRLPLSTEPVAITVVKIGDKLLVDPLPDEECMIDARLTVAVTEHNEICALQKGGEAPLSVDEINELVALALEKAPELRKKL